jgi:hypothetical protein
MAGRDLLNTRSRRTQDELGWRLCGGRSCRNPEKDQGREQRQGEAMTPWRRNETFRHTHTPRGITTLGLDW